MNVIVLLNKPFFVCRTAVRTEPLGKLKELGMAITLHAEKGFVHF
jgi:hypothetical protein